MRVSLRGYQAFGAKFALCQERAMLGDEMGLGKSVEALAVMCHLHVEGHRHFLVVCPASVLVNWTHEISRHSELRSHRLHGPDRQQNLRAWARTGGIAVTTYDSLKSLDRPPGVDLGMQVVDEAHYAKNTSAERTKAVRQWAGTTNRVLFLTGTPMENRVEEFQVLVSHLRPDLMLRVNNVDGLIGAGHFRTSVAPVYLRRNQSDVLEELPPRVGIEDWVELKTRDLDAYRHAVAAGNFMAMRRAAYAPGRPADSAKLGRLVEIVEEAAANGRKASDRTQTPSAPRPWPAETVAPFPSRSATSLNRTNVRSSRRESGMPIGPRRPGDDAKQSFDIAAAADRGGAGGGVSPGGRRS